MHRVPCHVWTLAAPAVARGQPVGNRRVRGSVDPQRDDPAAVPATAIMFANDKETKK